MTSKRTDSTVYSASLIPRPPHSFVACSNEATAVQLLLMCLLHVHDDN